MEIEASPRRWSDRIGKLFLKEAKPLSEKRDVNWPVIIKFGAGFVVLLVIVLLVIPGNAPEQLETFTEKTDPKSAQQSADIDPSQETIDQLQRSQRNTGGGAPDLNTLMGANPNAAQSGGAGSTKNMNTPMILVRGGIDSRTQLAPGSKIFVKLVLRTVISTQNMPITGLITKDVVQDSDLAIPEGSKLLGEASFNDSTERANIMWHQIIFPDGRQRDLGAIGIGMDGKQGVEGNVHSEALKNTIGQTVTRFVGAYAEGSMTRTQMGQSAGGDDNGLKNAIAETAKDRAQSWGEDLKKSNKWIELEAGLVTIAILNQQFTFRDPGSIR